MPGSPPHDESGTGSSQTGSQAPEAAKGRSYGEQMLHSGEPGQQQLNAPRAPPMVCLLPRTSAKRYHLPPAISPSRPYISIVHGSARGGAIHSGRGAGGTVVVQGDNKHLSGLLHQGLPVVREEQVVVGDAVAHRVVGTHGVEERGEERQCVSAGESGAELQGCSPEPASQATEGAAELLGCRLGPGSVP